MFITGPNTGINRNFAGNGTLGSSQSGLVTFGGVPTSARIFIFDNVTKNSPIVAGVRSDANGEWSVAGLNENRFYKVVAQRGSCLGIAQSIVQPVV